jgi:polyisoprenoid-binding protein YceI
MGRYWIDPSRSRFTIQGFAAGLLSAFAHSPTFAAREFRGEVRLGGTAESLELEMSIDADSLDLQDRVGASDRRDIESRMRGEVLETSVFREIDYRGGVTRAETIGQGRYRLVVGGELTLHGVTRPHRVDAELVVFGDGLRLGGGCPLRMSEHGIRPVTALGGTIKLKDELRISFDMAALPASS